MTTPDVSAAELRAFVERIEAQQAEKDLAADYMRETYAEAKGRGYCAKTIRKIVALRKKYRDALAEEEAVEEMYRAALGMA